jgi:hypothetical protein
VDGFIRISRDANTDDELNNVGVCGIMTLPSYPELDAAAMSTPAASSAVVSMAQKTQTEEAVQYI